MEQLKKEEHPELNRAFDIITKELLKHPRFQKELLKELLSITGGPEKDEAMAQISKYMLKNSADTFSETVKKLSADPKLKEMWEKLLDRIGGWENIFQKVLKSTLGQEVLTEISKRPSMVKRHKKAWRLIDKRKREEQQRELIEKREKEGRKEEDELFIEITHEMLKHPKIKEELLIGLLPFTGDWEEDEDMAEIYRYLFEDSSAEQVYNSKSREIVLKIMKTPKVRDAYYKVHDSPLGQQVFAEICLRPSILERFKKAETRKVIHEKERRRQRDESGGQKRGKD